MKNVKNILLLFAVALLLTAQAKQQASYKTVPITWVANLDGDYSFINRWSYNENVFRNNFGELTCDGDCPPGIDSMQDSNGRIYDSLVHAYYTLLDTTHQFHTLECEAWCYEFGEADDIDVTRRGNRVYATSRENISTHSSLRLNIENNVCTPTIKLTSIMGPGNNIFYYHCIGGYIKIDKTCWLQGVMKAEFDFTFFHPENPKKKMYWKGKIYAKITGDG